MVTVFGSLIVPCIDVRYNILIEAKLGGQFIYLLIYDVFADAASR